MDLWKWLGDVTRDDVQALKRHTLLVHASSRRAIRRGQTECAFPQNLRYAANHYRLKRIITTLFSCRTGCLMLRRHLQISALEPGSLQQFKGRARSLNFGRKQHVGLEAEPSVPLQHKCCKSGCIKCLRKNFMRTTNQGLRGIYSSDQLTRR